MRLESMFMVGACVVGGTWLGGAIVLAEACTPAQQAQAVSAAELAAKVVLADLLLGKSLGTIEGDVTSALADAGIVVADIALVVEDAINLLIDAGSIPAAKVEAALGIRAQAHAARKP